MNKEKFTRVGLEPICDLRIDVPGLYQLSYVALHWRSPYFVNIFVYLVTGTRPNFPCTKYGG